MKKQKHIVSLLLCFLVFISFSVTVSANGASPSSEPTSGEEVSGEENEETNTLPLFSVDESQPVKFTQEDTEYTLFPASLNADTNDDGNCNAMDARNVLRISAKLDAYSGDISAFDVSKDGVISANDARLILRYSAKVDNYYFDSDGSCPEGFVTDENGNVYYFENSVISIGLKTIGGSIYYFSADSGMVTGLTFVNGSVYYFDENGKAVSGKLTLDGKQYYFENGKAKTGYFQDGNSYYYYNDDGAMMTGFVNIDGKVYYFGSDGKAANGKMTVNGSSYYFENGKAKTGLYKEGSSYYYYNSDGKMVTGKLTVNGVLYDFGTDGKGQPCKDPSTYKIAMIGDSLVANIGSQDVTTRIDFYGKVSLHANTIFTKKVSGSSRYIIDEVKDRNYDVVIILVGINDLTYDNTTWAAQYRSIIRGVKERSPNSIIYAHAILPINETVAKNSGYSCTNAQIKNKNTVIKQVAGEEGVNYIDAAAILADSNGSLPANAASDGIHINKTYCKTWSDWLIKTICK